MVIAERVGHKFRGDMQDIKPQVPVLKMESVFVSNTSMFTKFGQDVFGLMINNKALSETGMSLELRQEIASNVKARCVILGFEVDHLPQIEMQMEGLIKNRESEIIDFAKAKV